MQVEKMFEQGPIRPPSEARSLLLRFTRNCPWNRCTFCPVYKGRSFSRRNLKEIKSDIDAVRGILDDIQRLSWSLGEGGRASSLVLSRILPDPSYPQCYKQVALWSHHGLGTVFIQDANSLIMSTSQLVEALGYMRKKIPGIRRVTSYARSSTLARKSLRELGEIHEAGLDRIHIGLESGSDQVLYFVRKGVKARQHVEAGRKVIEAGMTLSEYIMPGLGGRRWSREHALETARVLNDIDPHFIRLRSLRIPSSTPLYHDLQKGTFEPLHDDEVVMEIRWLIEHLEGIRSTLTSDHIMNLIEDVEGTLPNDKDHMLSIIDRYLDLTDEERLLYRLGRRGGAIRSFADFEDPSLRLRLEKARRHLESESDKSLDELIKELGDQYI